MPYKRIGTKIYHKKGGKWKVKQTAKSVKNAEKALKLLRSLDSGSIKPSEVGKGKFAKKKKKSSSMKKMIRKNI